ncbi:unnamed protein product [Hermetia illucens]|uniref:Trichoplein keratin filament-binding protein n=1 Tax=Hermetia illucens TaxID=343691 RepID=A0A7R8V4Q3_HERIL|nr:trichoplein keratin filament-binding protein [Hermetia illucens]CAD7092429.1 unnamed protein product [Hermetia illucens]
MKTQRLQAAFARRREADIDRIERTSAVNKYFDHWSKVTSRFESWTDPEYYQQAEESLRKEKEKKLKEAKLEERRSKLRQLLNSENAKYQQELQEVNKPKPRKLPNDLLEKLDRDQKYLSEEKRRLELESKLYGKWRYGVNDENVLFESKTNNEALAKLNWLDKQIEKRMHQEEEAKQAEERRLKILEETRKREENLKEQQKLREAELKELRAMQESNLTELKGRELQSIHLREKEVDLREKLEKIANELHQLRSRKQQKQNAAIPHNIKRIKMYIRQRSEEVREDLQQDIHALNRILNCHSSEDAKRLKSQFEAFYKAELQKQSTIEAMYESEAKHNLIKWEAEWAEMSNDREAQIALIFKKIKTVLEAELSENLDEQKRLVEIRQQHVALIENSNEKLKALVREQKSFIQAYDQVDANSSEVGGENVKDEEVLKMANCSLDESSPRRPKFGRKRVAWT